MKKIISIFLATTAITTISFADNSTATTNDKDFYVRVDAGKNFAKKITDKVVNDDVNEVKYQSGKLKNDVVLNLGVGTYLDDNFRTEISLSQRDFKLNNNTATIGESETTLKYNRSQKIKSTTLMLNGYYDFGTFSSVTPYVQVGLGLARNKAKDLTINTSNNDIQTIKSTYKGKTSNNLAWQIGAGASAAITETIKFDLGYKYIDLGKAKTNNGTSLDLSDLETTQKTAATAKLRAHEVTAGLRFDF